MYRIAVVEDEAASRDKIVRYLQRYGEQHEYTYDVHAFENGGAFVMSEGIQYDVVFLDIEMPVMNGMETAREIRKVNSQVIIVFITNLANYAVQGYEVEALDFLIKPLTFELFEFKLDRIMERVEMRRRAKSILVETKEGAYKVDVEKLSYVEVDHHTVSYHIGKEILSVRGSLRDAEEALNDCGFFKCNQCYLVNLRHVTGVREDEVCLGDVQLKISRGNKKKLLSALSAFMVRA